MRKDRISRLVLLAPALALFAAGCGEVVDEHAERTGNAIAADVDAATANLVGSVDALANTIDSQADRVADRALEDATRHAANQVDHAAEQLRGDLRAHTDAAADRAGTALEDVGRALRDRDRGSDAER